MLGKVTKFQRIISKALRVIDKNLRGVPPPGLNRVKALLVSKYLMTSVFKVPRMCEYVVRASQVFERSICYPISNSHKISKHSILLLDYIANFATPKPWDTCFKLICGL